MTPRQKQLLDFIARRWAEDGWAPTYDEMRRHLGLRSKSNIHRMVTALEFQGRVARIPGRRSLTLTTGLPLPAIGVFAQYARACLAAGIEPGALNAALWNAVQDGRGQ